MVGNVSTIHETEFAFYEEVNPGESPGYTPADPEGTAAGWEAAEGISAFRLRVFEMDPAWIRPTNIEDPAMVDSVWAKNDPIRGLSSAEGGALVLGMHGAEVVTPDGSQVAETAVMKFLKNALGGIHRSNSTTITAVADNTNFTVAAATNIVPGCLIGLEDPAKPNRVYFARVKSVTGTDLVIDEAPDFTVTTSTVIHGVATLYPDADALQCGPTLTIYERKGDDIWTANGCKPQLDTISLPRNEQPLLNFSLWASRTFPPSTNDSITQPNWVGDVEGAPGIPVGKLYTFRNSDFDTTPFVCIDATTLEFTAGVPVIPIDTVTQCDAANEGRAGYTTGPADTMINAQVFLDIELQDGFDTTQPYETSIELNAEAGKAWCIKEPSSRLMESPEYSQANDLNMHSPVFVAHETDDVTNVALPNLAKAKFLIGMA